MFVSVYETLMTCAWELHSHFSPTLTFRTDRHDGQQTDQHELRTTPTNMKHGRPCNLPCIVCVVNYDVDIYYLIGSNYYCGRIIGYETITGQN